MASLGEPHRPVVTPDNVEVQVAKKLVVERSNTLGCKQCHIPNDFLAVDIGQPLSGRFSLQTNLTNEGFTFYIRRVFPSFSHGRSSSHSLLFLSFAHDCAII